jgi:predicted amidohydrolase YtcJ
MSRIALAILAFWIGTSVLTAQAPVPPELIHYPDLILHNGKILTVDESFRTAEAVAVREGVFLAVGTNQEILAMRGPATRSIDLQGKTVIPGFVASDADNDFVGGNLYKDTVVGGKILGTLRDVDTKEKILRKVREYVAARPRGETIFLRLPDEGAEGMRLTKDDIDPLTPNHPVALNVTSFDMVVNSLMLAKVAALLPGGERHPSVVKDARTGRPNGQIFGHAMGVAGWDLRPWPVIDDAVLNEQKQMLRDLNQRGITSMIAHLQGFNLTVLNVLYHRSELTMRVFATHDFLRQNPNSEAYLRRLGTLVDFGLGDMVRIVGAGLSAMDGNADSGSALTIDPKLRSGGIAFGPHGQNTWIGFGPHTNLWSENKIPKELTEWNNVQQAIKHGWNTTGIHNVGDQSTQIWLETIEEGMKQPDIVLRPQWRPFGLDHNLFWNEKSYSRIEELDFRRGLGKMFQRPELAVELYGDRLHDAQPVPELIRRGFKVHIEGTEPLEELQHYISRKDAEGRVWGPDHAVDRQTALRMKTIWAARYIAEDKNLGSIERGKKADLAVLGADFLTVPEEQIEKIPVVMTVVGGRIAYERP